MPDVFGVRLEELPEGISPIEALVVVKALDEDGDLTFYSRCSDGLSTWEAIGMLITTTDQLRKAFSASFVPEDDDDD